MMGGSKDLDEAFRWLPRIDLFSREPKAEMISAYRWRNLDQLVRRIQEWFSSADVIFGVNK